MDSQETELEEMPPLDERTLELLTLWRERRREIERDRQRAIPRDRLGTTLSLGEAITGAIT